MGGCSIAILVLPEGKRSIGKDFGTHPISLIESSE